LETIHSIMWLEESFEGRSPRALEAERGPQGLYELKAVERVAKPYERDFQGARQRMLDAFARKCKEGPYIPEMLKGQDARQGAF